MTTRAYPAEPTVAAGGVLRVHVATDAPRFRLRIFRHGTVYRRMPEIDARFEGLRAPARGPGEPWSWPAYAVPIPKAWPPGAYVAHVDDEGAASEPAGPDARAGTALFVVRAAARASLVVNLPLFTYHAYNIADVDGTAGAGEGACLYSGPRAVSLHRPGGGTGGHTWDAVNVDAYDAQTPRQTFAHWDAKALAWLERAGYAHDVCTDLDLHRGIALAGARLLVAFGHQEYWTRAMRAYVERFTRAGGNVALFCGNTSWFRVRYDAANVAIERDGTWSDDAPEEAWTGTSYRFGGGRWRGPRPPAGYTVRDAGHWAFAGTGLRAGETFGAAARLVGYECDGRDPAGSVAALADAELAGWDDGDGFAEVHGRATMTALPLGAGTVFNAATVDWPRVLAAGDPIVDRVTRNVLDRLGAGKRE